MMEHPMISYGSRPFNAIPAGPPIQQLPPKPEEPVLPELQVPRFLNYYADYSGCGHWRMIWPEQIMNAHNKAVRSWYNSNEW